MSVENIKPLQDRVVVKRDLGEEKTKSGIVIPDTAKEKPIKGKVVAVGTGKVLESGEIRPPVIKIGEKVLFGKYSGTEVKFNDEEYIVMREDDIMATIED